MCKFPLTGCLQKVCKNFFAKLVQSVSLCQRLSKKLNFIKIWQLKVGQNKDLVCYWKKQSFRQCAWGLRQLVLKPGLGLKRGLWVMGIKEVRKFQQGGGQIDLPPPSRDRANFITLQWDKLGMKFETLIAWWKSYFSPCCRAIQSLNHPTTLVA